MITKRKEKYHCLLPQHKQKQFAESKQTKKLTAKQAGEEIGVTQVTYRKNPRRRRSKTEHLPKSHLQLGLQKDY